jgi:hypothetical protein
MSETMSETAGKVPQPHNGANGHRRSNMKHVLLRVGR